MNKFIIFEDSVHALVFFAQAADEVQAWKLYLERERSCVEQADGTYRTKPFVHDDLEDVFITYGIISHDDASYSNTDGLSFRSLDEVRSVYGVEEQSDGTYISRKSYQNLAEALRQTVGHHHIEIAPCSINDVAQFQTLFVSKDKWDYVELDTPEDLKADILSQHLWQAERYTALGRSQDAVAELKKALKLANVRKKRLRILLNLAWLLRSLGKLATAAKHYREALQIATEYDNRASIRYILAGVYEEMKQPSKALWHYKKVPLEDLDDKDGSKIAERIMELEQAGSTTATA